VNALPAYVMDDPSADAPTLTAKVLDADDIDRLVKRSFRKGQPCLFDLFNRAVFGPRYRHQDVYWSQWPMHARASWTLAIARYRELRAGGASRPKARTVTLADTWAAIEELGTGPWWRLRDVTHHDFARELSVGPRAVPYWLVIRHNWHLVGRGEKRRIVAAPCAECGSVVPVAEVQCRRCAVCAEN
jgi:hypothetical protein